MNKVFLLLISLCACNARRRIIKYSKRKRQFILKDVDQARTVNSSEKHADLRVYKGQPAKKGSYEYVVSIVDIDFDRVCTGTLITPKWTITAAHCEPETVYVRWGNLSKKKGQKYRKIVKRILHPSQQYLDRSKFYINRNDVALYLIDAAIQMKSYGKLSAVDYGVVFGRYVTYAGYGTTLTTSELEKNETAAKLDTLLPLQVGVGIAIKCDVEDNGENQALQMCVAPLCENHQVTLPGDSGGPLFYAGKVIAILSSSEDLTDGTMSDPLISYYMPLSPQLMWISNIVSVEPGPCSANKTDGF